MYGQFFFLSHIFISIYLKITYFKCTKYFTIYSSDFDKIYNIYSLYILFLVRRKIFLIGYYSHKFPKIGPSFSVSCHFGKWKKVYKFLLYDTHKLLHFQTRKKKLLLFYRQFLTKKIWTPLTRNLKKKILPNSLYLHHFLIRCYFKLFIKVFYINVKLFYILNSCIKKA